MLGTRFPEGGFEWPAKKWLKTYRESKAKAAALANDETDKSAKKSSVHDSGRQPGAKRGLGCEPSEDKGRPLPSDSAKAMREIAEAGSRPRATHDGGCQPREDSGNNMRMSSKSIPTSQHLSMPSKWAADKGI